MRNVDWILISGNVLLEVDEVDLRNFNRVFFCRYDLFDDNKVNLRNIHWALISWDYLLNSHIMNLRKFDWELMSVSFRYLDLLDFC